MKKINIAYIVIDKNTAEMASGLTPINVPEDYRIEDLIKESNAKSVSILDGGISGMNWFGRMSQKFDAGEFHPEYNNYFLHGIDSLEEISNFFDKYKNTFGEQKNDSKK